MLEEQSGEQSSTKGGIVRDEVESMSAFGYYTNLNDPWGDEIFKQRLNIYSWDGKFE